MKHNRKRSLISLVMVFAMLLSYIPGTAWAVDSSTDIKAIQKPTGISIVEDYDDYYGDLQGIEVRHHRDQAGKG